MDFSKLVRLRKTTYEFDGKRRIPANHLKKILEAAQWAPSCGNTQPWHFIIVKDKARIESLLDSTHFVNFPFISPSPSILIAVVLDSNCLGPEATCAADDLEGKEEDPLMCIGMSSSQAVLQAELLGINSCILTPKRDQANKILKLKKNQDTVLYLGFGYEKKGAYQKERTRKKLSEITSYEQYGNKKINQK